MRSDSGFLSGSYSFPVKFEMPWDMPGTFVFTMGDITAFLNYNIYCEIFTIDGELIGRAWAPLVV